MLSFNFITNTYNRPLFFLPSSFLHPAPYPTILPTSKAGLYSLFDYFNPLFQLYDSLFPPPYA